MRGTVISGVLLAPAVMSTARWLPKALPNPVSVLYPLSPQAKTEQTRTIAACGCLDCEMLVPLRYHAPMDRYDWTRLNHLQVGRYAEYFVKMEFTLFDFDVYTTEVDNKGIDFVVRKDLDRYYDVQVKSLRVIRSSYAFMPKSSFALRENLLLALVLLYAGEPPVLYLIPATAWRQPDSLLVEREYPNLTSKPEWGVTISRRNRPLLERFAFAHVAPNL